MIDEEATSSVVEETESTSESSGETESTQEVSENMVPQSRFKEVINERNSAREELGSMKARIAALEAEPEPGNKNDATYDTKAPPEGLSKEQEIEWWVRKFSGPAAEEVVAKKLGMSLEEAAERLKLSKQTAQASEEARWQAACERHGLDPKSKDVQGIASGLAKVNPDNDLDTVLASTAKYVGVTKKSNGAHVEQGGVSGIMASPDWVPKNAAEAAAGAKQGRRAKHRSTVEIIEARLNAKP